MFDKFLNKKPKPIEYFEIPVKNYNFDSKNISKLGHKQTRDIYSDQQKYITTIVKKVRNESIVQMEQAKEEYLKVSEKCDELAQKNQIINQEISRMTN